MRLARGPQHAAHQAWLQRQGRGQVPCGQRLRDCVFLCAGRVDVEGPLSDDYFEVRRLVYSQFVLLQGSRASLLDNYNINLNAD
jgi:hypothetical protein